MDKKTILTLLIMSIMLISVGAISAADANETLMGEVSDTEIAMPSVAVEQDNAISPESESGGDVEINVTDSRDKISISNEVKVTSKSTEVLSASNDDVLKADSDSFYWDEGNEWFTDLRDAMDHIASSDSKIGTIYCNGGTYSELDQTTCGDIYIKFSSKATITILPFDGQQVIFDGKGNDYLFWFNSKDVKITFNNIIFKKGHATNDGGAIEVNEAQVTLNNCILTENHASDYGGAVSVANGGTFVANNCQFLNNKADDGGGAISCEKEGSVTLNNCYFEGNKVGDTENDFGYEHGGDEPGSWEFNDCRFKGHGSIDWKLDAPSKSITITADVEDDVNNLVLYNNSNNKEVYREDWNPGSTKPIRDLLPGTYTIYMLKVDLYGNTKRYGYPGTTFTIIEPNFILDDKDVFENLSAAVNAIPNGGTGVITVEADTYTDPANFNVQIRNKKVTIMSKDSESVVPVTFSGNSYNYLLDVGSNSQLIMEDITITGKFSNSALIFNTNQECTIYDCEFNNIVNSQNEPGTPIYVQNSNLILNDTTFESNGQILFKNTIVNIDGCTFTSNNGTQGGAINADASSDLTVTGSKFSANVASDKGGAIYATKLKIESTKFYGNIADLGGAVYITDDANSPVNITGCVFDFNIATSYRNIFTESQTREINLEFNEYDLNLTIIPKDASYGSEYIVEGDFDWGTNLNNNHTLLMGYLDDENLFVDLITVENNKYKINMGVLSGGSHELSMSGMYTQGDSADHFHTHHYYSDLAGNEFYLGKDDSGMDREAYAKILIDKASISLNLVVNNVSIPDIPVLNIYANYDLNYTIFIGNKYYQVEVVNGKANMQLTGLDLGNHTVVAMRNADENFNLALNFTTFSINKTYSNFVVLSTNVEYDTLSNAVANSNDIDTIYVKNGTYKDTGILISDKSLDIIALGNVVFDAQGTDANFIIVNETADVHIYGITFRGLRNRNTNYGAIVNYGDLSIDSCNFTDNTITKTSFAENGGAAIFNKGYSLEINNCTFINNVAPLKVSTAAVTSLSNEDVTITASKFINNSAREGGALHFKNIAQYEEAIISCDFEHNTAVKGSAIYVGSNSKYLGVTLSGFKKNDIKNSLGENTQLEGGVIYVNANTSQVTLDISLSNFENNSHRDVDGGAICLDGSSNAHIESCIFNNNTGKLGSVILIKNLYNKKLTLFIDNSNFINNHATSGSIATFPKVTALIDECLFANNTGENRHIYSNGFTVVHDSTFEVKDAKLTALSVQYGENSIINGTADIGTNIYAVANLTVAGENVTVEVKNNSFSYKTDILNHGKYFAVLNNIVDTNNNTYLMDSITEIFRVNRVGIKLNISVDNITYGETLKVIETLPSSAIGTINYQFNGKYYTKDEIEALKLDAGKYTLVAIYDNEDYALSSSIINFEVYKANPIISVADVEIEYGNTIIVNIETNVPSIYTIEIGDYKNVTFINGSKSVEIEKTFEPGTYTIKVTSQERVNYISNFTEATLKVNKNLATFTLGASNKIIYPDNAIIEVSAPDNAVGNIAYTISDSNNNIVYTAAQSCKDDLIIPGLDAGNYEVNAVFEGDDLYYPTDNIQKLSLSIRKTAINANNENIRTSTDIDNLDEEYEEGRFLYQEDEDSDYEFFDTLDDAIDEAVLRGEGIITVRGGTYTPEDGICGIEIEGEVELTIKAFEDEEVIFDCGGENYFLHLTYDTEIEWIKTVPPIPVPYTTEGPTITLENITIRNGNNDEGGAIELIAGTLTMINCNFYDNKAEDYGGAICIGSRNSDQDATVTAVNCTFIGNTAGEEGGAIYIMADLEQESTASFYLCTFFNNYQGEDEEREMNYYGGDIVDDSITSKYCVFNGTGTIDTFKIDKINQTVTVVGTSSNSFDSVVLLYSNQVPLYTIYNNGSYAFNVIFEDVVGGNYTLGVMNDHDFNTYVFGGQFEVKVPNFIISEDEVYENLTDAIEAVAENGIIYANANYHDEDHMEIDISKSFTLKNFRNRTVVFDGSGEKWFFTVAEGYNVVFENINFVDGAIKNSATIENYGDLTLKNCSFDNFETSTIVYNSGVLNILNGEFSLNFLDDSIVWNDNELVIDTVEFSSNVVNKSSVVYNKGNARIVSSNFTDNYNGGNGGAIYNINSLFIKDTVFNENEGKDGGAVYNDGTLKVLNSAFEDNTANGYGGAIFNNDESNIFNSSFTGGFSEKDGGALYNNGKMAVNNSTFVGNTATGKGGAIYNNNSLELTESFFGINYADEFANIYNAGDIQFSENTFDFYDVILIVPDGQYGIPTTISGTLDPQFNIDIEVTLPEFVNHNDATVFISEGIFEYDAGILPKGIYDVILNEVIYDSYGNIYYGESKRDRLIVHKANVYINLTVDDIIIKDASEATPVLKISVSKNGTYYYLFNNKLLEVNIAGSQETIELDSVGEGNYSVMVVFGGDENYNEAVNGTTFKVTEYEGNFIVNSTGGKFDTLDEAIDHAAAEDIIYVMEGTYTGADNIGLIISNKKLTITPLGDVVFDANSTDLSFLTIDENSDVTMEDIVINGFKVRVIDNKGNLTVDGCTFVNNTLSDNNETLIYNTGKLNIVESRFYDNKINKSYIIESKSDIIINESTFENNTIYNYGSIILLNHVNSAKVISAEFVENTLESGEVINVLWSRDVLINAEFYNNTQGTAIWAFANSNLNIENSTFIGNNLHKGNSFYNIIKSIDNNQSIISGCTFTDNTVSNVVYSWDKNLSVLESTFSANKLSDNGALNIESQVNAIVNGSVFTDNMADKYRNIYSDSTDLNISNSVFDAINVDYTVYDIDYKQVETIEGSIDIGTNLKFTVNLDINGKTYSVNVTDNKFTFNAGILNGGDYKVVLNSTGINSNTFVFNKITKMFTVNRIDPGLNASISDITYGEKLQTNIKFINMDEKINRTVIINGTKKIIQVNRSATANVFYELNGKKYNKTQLENILLDHGSYLVSVIYGGDKDYLPATVLVNFEVYKITPNITVSDVEVNYGDMIKINVTVDVADYYTVFIGDEPLSYEKSLSLYVEDTATFIFSSEDYKPDSYKIVVYVFETDDYNEAYGYANLTVNKNRGFFNLSNDLIYYGENANISVEVPVSASGNIIYKVYDSNMELVYNITQSCLEELIVPNLYVGTYMVTGTFEGDSYYTNDSIVNSSIIIVLPKTVDLNISASNMTYGEKVTVIVDANIDGEYLVYVGNESMKVTVINGTGNISVPNLGVGSYVVNVTAIDGNYSAFNETVFDVTPKSVSVIVSVEDITYGEDAIVWVYCEIDGEYIVKINNQNYTVNVFDGKGNTSISDLAINKDILASVTIANSNYSAYNTTTFNVNKINSTLNIENIEFDYNSSGSTAVSYEGATGINASVVNQPKAIVNVTTNTITVSGLDVGTYTLTVTTIPDAIHNPVTKTVAITVNKIDSTLFVDDLVFDYNSTGSTEVIFDGATGIEASVENQPQAIVKIENDQITVSGLNVGTYTLTVTTIPDVNHNPVTKTATIIVNKIDSILFVDDLVFDYNSTGSTNVIFDGATGIEASVENQPQAIVKIENDQITVSGLNAGTYTLKVTTIPDNNHISVTKTVTIIVNKIDSILSVVNVELNYGGSVNVSVKADGAIGITAKIDDIEVGVNEFIIPISGLDVGTYTLTVTTIPDVNHNPVTKTATIIVNKIDSTLFVDDLVFDYNSTGSTNVIFDGATGIEASVENQPQAIVKIVNNQITVSGLNTGTYTLTVTTISDNNHNSVTKTADITVNKLKTELAGDAINTTCDVEKNLIVTLKDINGNPLSGKNITVDLNGVKTYVSDVNGQVKVSTKGLNPSAYIAKVAFNGDTNYEKSIKNIDVIITGEKIIVSAPDLVKYYSGPERFIVNISNAQGKPIANKEVNILLNAIVYTRITDEKGIVSLNIGLNAGEYLVYILVDNIGVNSTVTVKPTIYADDIVKVFRNDTQYYARFVDGNGNPLVNTVVSFNINGVLYHRTTDGKGTAKLNINLESGEYILTAINYVTGEMASNMIKVISLIESSDLIKYYKNDSQFVVRIHSSDGGYVGAGEEVKFNINGVIYTRTTNATGHVKLNINLEPGDYIITIYYKDYSLGNNIKVLPVLSAYDLVMKYMDGSQFKVKLLDGQGKAYPNQMVSFNINGVLYKRLTDSDGVAKLNIRLMPGEYIITSSYNGSNIANNVKITA